MSKWWHPRPFIWEAILFLVGLALQIGGWVNPTIAYILFGAAFALLIYDVIGWQKNKKRRQFEVLAKGIKLNLLEKLKTTGRVEDISQGDIDVIQLMSIELEGRHGYNDFTGLLADRASGVPLNELKTRPCSQCGIPRNQKGKHGK
jgi:hypothetical protein